MVLGSHKLRCPVISRVCPPKSHSAVCLSGRDVGRHLCPRRCRVQFSASGGSMKSLAIVMLMLVGSVFAQDRPHRSQRMSGTDVGVRQRMDQVWQAWDSKDLKRVSAFYVKD